MSARGSRVRRSGARARHALPRADRAAARRRGALTEAAHVLERFRGVPSGGRAKAAEGRCDRGVGLRECQGLRQKLAPFRAAGLEVFACPGVENWNRIFPNLGIAIPNIRGFSRAAQGDAAGALVCSWNDNGEALFGSNWYPLLYGAAAAWKRGTATPSASQRAFDWALFRNPGRQAADAIVRVSQAHDILRELRPMDATTELSWVNPARGNLDRQLLAMIAPLRDACGSTQSRV